MEGKPRTSLSITIYLVRTLFGGNTKSFSCFVSFLILCFHCLANTHTQHLHFYHMYTFVDLCVLVSISVSASISRCHWRIERKLLRKGIWRMRGALPTCHGLLSAASSRVTYALIMARVIRAVWRPRGRHSSAQHLRRGQMGRRSPSCVSIVLGKGNVKEAGPVCDPLSCSCLENEEKFCQRILS